MKNLIVFASKHGCAEKCAAQLGGRLQGETRVVNIKDAGAENPAGYDAVIIGGSIHAGRIQKPIREFAARNLGLLKTKRLGLFLCCMEEGDKAETQFAGAFPEELIKAAVAKGLFGGAFDFERMNWLEKKIIAKISGVKASVSKIKDENVDAFARAMNGTAS
jgi:menaquinone-dependent protoporphyrinogen oxidase